MKKVFLSLYHYLCFFLLMAFVITCCTMLFVSTMGNSMGIEFTEENIHTAAILTFWNVVFLSLLCTVIDALRRKLTVERPVRQIVAAAEQIARGDYSVRIPALKSLNRADGLDQIVACFNKMARELEGVETLQTDFIANVSHELKTPLAVIQNYGTLLQQRSLPEADRLRYAKTVSDASRRLADLISNILKLNKLENQQVYPAAQTYSLSEQLCTCLLRFESVWEEKGIDLETDLDEALTVHADPELLELVWNNLFSNAFKFTEAGGKVRLSVTREAGFAVVSVSDTGCGISPEAGRHIFDKFYQADTSHATEGNGLGLSLVRRVVSIVGGEIRVESELGRGSTFTVRLKEHGHG